MVKMYLAPKALLPVYRLVVRRSFDCGLTPSAQDDNVLLFLRKTNSTSFCWCCVACSVLQQLAVGTHLSEALAAENRTVGLGLEGNLCLATAACAGSGEELTGATGSVLASVTAGLAALGLVLEAALCVELLLTGGEHELVAALFAN